MTAEQYNRCVDLIEAAARLSVGPGLALHQTSAGALIGSTYPEPCGSWSEPLHPLGSVQGTQDTQTWDIDIDGAYGDGEAIGGFPQQTFRPSTDLWYWNAAGMGLRGFIRKMRWDKCGRLCYIEEEEAPGFCVVGTTYCLSDAGE